ncbi:MAG: hypothetical protein KAI70_05320 [Candidatus Omnitrophica bacterium]|nr:hypothetical protein [Candidatus Omnitrophota bacterium]
MDPQKDKILKNFIKHYQKKCFALTFCLVNKDQEKAYKITVSCFSDALRKVSFLNEKESFLVEYSKALINECRELRTLPYSAESNSPNILHIRKKTLKSINKALYLLSFDEKALLLLRDQMYFSYDDIAKVFASTESSIRSSTLQARLHFRKKIEEVLKNDM